MRGIFKTLFRQTPVGLKVPAPDPASEDYELEMVRYYHSESKHNFNRYARSPAYLDWDTEPDPFRRFRGAPVLSLPFMEEDDTPPYAELYKDGSISPQTVSVESVAQLFELSLALSAWKEYKGSRWSLRVNPSSGDLHPTEGYLVIGPSEGGKDACGFGVGPVVCHYAPAEHALEVRARLSLKTWRALMRRFPSESFLLGLSSIHWREAWKYGERAYRYCQHDAGHALAALRYSAAVLGWRLSLLEDLSDRDVARVLGLDRDGDFPDAEREQPCLLAVVVPCGLKTAFPSSLTAEAIKGVVDGTWQGRANRLSEDHVRWDMIEQVAKACEKPRTGLYLRRGASATDKTERPLKSETGERPESGSSSVSPSARQIIYGRRSAVRLDGTTGVASSDFYRMLARTMPPSASAAARPPWDAIRWPACLHLCLFVHLIDGLAPGLYVLVRDVNQVETLRAAMKPDFLWEKPADCLENLPLYFLQGGDCRRLAEFVSCEQEIAADGAFSLGMVAEFEESLRRYGAWHYRRLFWEAGMIGQVLYLEAEAVGLRSTGIGCFFDDPVHEIFGFSGWRYQSLYHFTVGGAVEDRRLTTLPPYSQEQRKRSKIGSEDSQTINIPSLKRLLGHRFLLSSCTAAS